ncbi:MAG: BRCT domain-containing protein [Clostridium sp.]|nr:BRCT domain-containing protein [Clostridium sp.]
MINPKREWKEFTSLNEKISILKKFEIISPKSTEIKKLYYKGTYSNYNAIECDVVGYVDDCEIILDVNGELHSILPDYFIEMQKRDRFIIVDIETPMSFSPTSGIREVAAIFVEDYRVTDSINLKVVSNEELYLKGYGQGLEAIEKNEELKSIFKSFVKKYRCPLIAHNASFDRNFLKYWGWIDDKTKFYCSMNNIKSRYKFESYKLDALLKEFNIQSTQTHTALKDVLDLLEILSITKIDKWTLLGESSSKENYKTPKVKPSYFVSKEKKENDKKKLEDAKSNIISNLLNNKKILFTGDTKNERTDLQVLAIKHGGTSVTSISKKTDLLVVGSNPGKSKIAKANELEITMITEDEFLEMIK